MITCSWCGKVYDEFQPTCDECGGSLPLPSEQVSDAAQNTIYPHPYMLPGS